jgi:type II secretory pathway pseudopilin PulG
MTHADRADDFGYTLIELTVVLLLLSFITLAIGSGLRFGTRVWEQTDTDVQAANRIDKAQSLLRQLLASAIPAGNGEYVEFEGDPRHLTFVAAAPRALRSADLVRIELSAITRDTTTSLHIAVHSMQPGAPGNLDVDPGASTLRMAYLDASQSVPVWLDRWRDRDRLPDAVRIEGGDDASRNAWPDLIVRLPIAQRPDCAFDPVSLECRRSRP